MTKYRYLLLTLILLFLNHCVIYAQEQKAAPDLSSPYKSLAYFLKSMSDEKHDPVAASKVFNPTFVSQKNASNLAIELQQILDGRGIYIDLDEVPKETNYLDSATNKNRYYFASVDYGFFYIEKVGNKWLFSKSTSDNIDRLHKETFPYGTDRLLNLLPKAGNYKILGLKLWQYLALFILIFLSFLIHLVLRNILRRLVSRGITKLGYEEEAQQYVPQIVIPVSYAVVFQLIRVVLPILQLQANISHYIALILGALFPLFITISLYRFVDLMSLHFVRLAEKTESTLDDQLVPLVRKTLKTFVVVIGVLFVLQNLRIDIVPLLAGLSIGGLAFALAAQDTIKNFFGSLMIFVDKPFQVGHWITSGDIDGTVEEVGFRSTRIRTFRNSLVYVPNGKIADSTVDNHGLRTYRRFFTTIAVTYDTPADLIELFVQGLRDLVKEHPYTRKDYYEIHFNDMGASSLDIMFYIFFNVPSWSEELRCRQEILLSIMRLANELGINFAFPTQTLHVENFPGQLSLSPTYGDPKDLQSQMEKFLKDNKKNFQN